MPVPLQYLFLSGCDLRIVSCKRVMTWSEMLFEMRLSEIRLLFILILYIQSRYA